MLTRQAGALLLVPGQAVLVMLLVLGQAVLEVPHSSVSKSTHLQNHCTSPAILLEEYHGRSCRPCPLCHRQELKQLLLILHTQNIYQYKSFHVLSVVHQTPRIQAINVHQIMNITHSNSIRYSNISFMKRGEI